MNSTEQFHVLKDGRRLGPYSIDELLEQVERGAVNYEDACLRNGSTRCERVREILDWDDEPAGQTSDETGAGFLDEFEPGPETAETGFDDHDDDEFFDAIGEPIPPGPPSDPNSLLYVGHPSFLSYPRTVFVILLSIGAGLWFRETSSWIFFFGLVIALFGVSWIFLQRSMRLYLVTPRRVEIVTGLIAKSSNEVRIEDIRTINVVKSGLAGLLGIGSVEFASSGGGTVEVAFKDCWAANRIKGLVRRLQDVQPD